MTVSPAEGFFTNVFLFMIRSIAHCHQQCACAFFAKSANLTSFYRLLEFFECHCQCQLLIVYQIMQCGAAVQCEDLLGFEQVGLWVHDTLCLAIRGFPSFCVVLCMRRTFSAGFRVGRCDISPCTGFMAQIFVLWWCIRSSLSRFVVFVVVCCWAQKHSNRATFNEIL